MNPKRSVDFAKPGYLLTVVGTGVAQYEFVCLTNGAQYCQFVQLLITCDFSALNTREPDELYLQC